MPSTAVRNGLYWSDRTRTWHFEFRFRGQKHNGDTGIGSSRDLAAGWLKKHKEGLAAREVGLVLPQDAPTVKATLAAWEAAMQGVVDDRHITNMRCAILVHCRELLNTPLPQITTTAVERIRTAYLNTTGKGYRTGQDWEATRAHTPGGANTVVKLLSSLLGWAVSQETMGLQKRPFTLKPLKAQKAPQGILWPEQVQAFLAEADRGGHDWADPDRTALPHSATAIRLMLALGLRESEAVSARWEWLDLRRQVYTVGKAKNRKIREVPVPDWLLDHLQTIRPEGTAKGLILPASRDEDGIEVPHHKTFTAKPVARIGRKLKIAGLTPHRLRATFATAHFEAGTPLSQIQQMLGHKDPQTTMGYIVQRPKDQAAAQARVAESMGFPTSSPSQVPGEKESKSAKRSKKA